jgi:hypothetical protein
MTYKIQYHDVLHEVLQTGSEGEVCRVFLEVIFPIFFG